MRILVTGANGQLGSTFRAITSEYPNHDLHFFGSKELDITNSSSVKDAFDSVQPEMVVNCAAYTAVDQAEDEPEKAFAVNAEGVKHLVEACKLKNAALIHISTDYVFDGTNHRPYVETDPVNPIGVYGKSKRAGEEVVLDSNISAIIVRTSWVYSEFGNNFVKTMVRLGRERNELNVIFDQVGSPTNTYDLARVILSMIVQNEKWQGKQEVFHYSNEGVCSWYDFALAIFEISGIECEVNPILTKEYPTKAVRPHYSVLDKTGIKQVYNIQISNWRNSFNTIELKNTLLNPDQLINPK